MQRVYYCINLILAQIWMSNSIDGKEFVQRRFRRNSVNVNTCTTHQSVVSELVHGNGNQLGRISGSKKKLPNVLIR
jgi:hypothetical protein